MEVQEVKEQLKSIFRQVINDNKVENWNEQDHPRDEQGKFTEKGGGSAKDYYESEYQKALKEIAEGRDYAQINYNTNIGEMKSALAHLKRFNSDWDAYDVYENIKEYEDLSDDWNKEQIGRIAREKAAQETLKKWISEGKDRLNEYYKIYEPHKAKNSKEQDMAILEMLKEFISKVENDKGDNMINNEKEDKRELIDEVGGILKGKVDDEIIRTIIKKMEEVSYNESEAGSADNKKVKNEADDEDEKVENKKVKNEETEEDKEKVKELKEDEKKDVENKCNNSKETFFDKMNKIYNSSVAQPKDDSYVSRADRLKAGEDYFKV